ncbi:hypothetical protein [Oceanicoccus sp. KOV_DT_Chl]|uniref:hypothetical protein n=1 Tax=Oceanicoccus sp. KOV_DT_Chl TaxID=1904639 RepID=UPI000C7B54D3|nr:hypothetical protein [Oceanicoccus sp. KOV_DT_Chl]
MPCDIEWRGRSIHWKFHGAITSEQLIKTYSSLYGDARFDDTRGQVRDYSQVTELHVSFDDVLRIAAFDKAAAKSNPRMKIAFVFNNQEYSSLASLYDSELDGGPWQVNFFTCANEAIEWVA